MIQTRLSFVPCQEVFAIDDEYKIGVLGAGMMGAEIAHCFAMSGYRVIMKEINLELDERGKVRLQGVLKNRGER